MSANENPLPTSENKTPLCNPCHSSSVTVTVKDSLGAIFLGILSVILLVEWIRAEARNRVLITQMERPVDDDLPTAR